MLAYGRAQVVSVRPAGKPGKAYGGNALPLISGVASRNCSPKSIGDIEHRQFEYFSGPIYFGLMEKDHKQSERRTAFWLGIGTGAAGVVFLFSLLLSMASESTLSAISAFLYRWQTLIAGGLALAGAYLTVAELERQLAQEREQEGRRRWRKHYAARAGLPSALTQIVEYARQSLSVLEGIALPGSGSRVIHSPGWARPEIPSVPKEALATLQTCIESADQASMPKLARTLEEFQILHARLDGLMDDISPGSSMIVTTFYLGEQIVDYLEFDIRCSKMFDYARRVTDEIDDSVSFDEIRTRASFAGIELADYPGIEALIARRYSSTIT